jgi:hypothetical protein
MFLVPIFLVAGISISHVVAWYDISNPFMWAIYLSIAVEVGAITALIAATQKIKGGVWFMFGLVTFVQMVGNIFYSYKEIDPTGELFISWVELTSPLFELLGTETTDIISHKRWLAFLEGGLLPIISLTALHFFVKYKKEDEIVDKPKEEKLVEIIKEEPIKTTDKIFVSPGVFTSEKDYFDEDYLITNRINELDIFKEKPVEEVKEEITIPTMLDNEIEVDPPVLTTNSDLEEDGYIKYEDLKNEEDIIEEEPIEDEIDDLNEMGDINQIYGEDPVIVANRQGGELFNDLQNIYKEIEEESIQEIKEEPIEIKEESVTIEPLVNPIVRSTRTKINRIE